VDRRVRNEKEGVEKIFKGSKTSPIGLGGPASYSDINPYNQLMGTDLVCLLSPVNWFL
jgi:hypothetical protein